MSWDNQNYNDYGQYPDYNQYGGGNAQHPQQTNQEGRHSPFLGTGGASYYGGGQSVPSSPYGGGQGGLGPTYGGQGASSPYTGQGDSGQWGGWSGQQQPGQHPGYGHNIAPGPGQAPTVSSELVIIGEL